MIGLIEKVAFGDPIGQILDPIYQAAATAPLHDGSAWLALGFGFQIFFDFAGLLRHRDRHRTAVRHPAPVQLQRAVPRHQHPGLLAALAHDAVALPARLRVHAARRHADRGNPAHRRAVCRGDHADHGAVRPVARRRLELRPVGHDARRRHRVRSRLAARAAVTPAWSSAGQPPSASSCSAAWCSAPRRWVPPGMSMPASPRFPTASMLGKAWIVGVGMLLAIAAACDAGSVQARSTLRPLAWVPAVLGVVGVGLLVQLGGNQVV